MPVQQRTFGTPQISGTTIEQLRTSVQFWMQTLVNNLDQAVGLRGTAELHGPLDAKGNALKNVEAASEPSDAVIKSQTITRVRNPFGGDEAFDVDMTPLVNVPTGNERTDGINLGQLLDLLAQTLLAIAAINAPPAVALTSQLGTVTDRFAREDHTHGTLATVAPPAVDPAASVVGVATVLARQDHTHFGVDTATAQTITNKRITRRAVVIADAASLTPNADTTDVGTQENTQAAGTLTFNAPTGTPTNTQHLELRLNLTNAQTPSFNAIYRATTLALPVTLPVGLTRLGFEYHLGDTKWDLIAMS